jgi:hypothetical protein
MVGILRTAAALRLAGAPLSRPLAHHAPRRTQVEEVAALVERLHSLTPGWLLAGEQWKVRGRRWRGRQARRVTGRSAAWCIKKGGGLPPCFARPDPSPAPFFPGGQAFLYVSTQRRVVGLLVAEPIRQGFRVTAAPAAAAAAGGPSAKGLCD